MYIAMLSIYNTGSMEAGICGTGINAFTVEAIESRGTSALKCIGWVGACSIVETGIRTTHVHVNLTVSPLCYCQGCKWSIKLDEVSICVMEHVITIICMHNYCTVLESLPDNCSCIHQCCSHTLLCFGKGRHSTCLLIVQCNSLLGNQEHSDKNIL